MAAAFEKDQVGKEEELMKLITNIEAQDTPLTSMMPVTGKPKQKLIQYQSEAFGASGHKGVMDGKDADEFLHIPRANLKALSQKTWFNPAVSDFAEESEVAGAPSGEMARQKANALVMVKRQIERRAASDAECQEDNGADVPNETRGAYKWLESDAQALYPVPDGFRTPAASRFTGKLSEFTEAALVTMLASLYKQRKSASTLKGIVGTALKQQISTFSMYVPTVSNFTATRQVNQDAKARTLINSIMRLEMDTGDVDLLLSSYMLTDETTGDDSASTTRSGLFLDMRLWKLAYTRKPRIKELEDRGGGPRAIVDAMFAVMCLAPAGNAVAEISED